VWQEELLYTGGEEESYPNGKLSGMRKKHSGELSVLRTT
jgi:hypothetical protein